MAASIKLADKSKNSKVIQPLNISIKQIQRSSQDIDSWRNALKSFDSLTNPNRVKLYDLLDDISLDGQIEATWGKRVDAISNTPLIFSNDGKEDEQINKLLTCPDMTSLMKDIHSTIAFGYTLIQINDIIYNEDEEQYHILYSLIDRRHVHPEPGFECVSIEQNQATKDFLYKEQPLSDYMLYMGDYKDKGLLFKAAQYVIYKRGGYGDWAQFVECFGMPFREMTYDEYDEATRVKLEEMLKNWGAFGYMLHPKNSELTLHSATATSGTSVYKELIDACDASISKTILGNTLTTEQGSSGTQALGSVHLSVEEEKKNSDRLFVLSILNTQFKAILKRFGFKVSGGNIWFASPEKDWQQLATKWNVISGIASRIPVSDDFIYETFDIPKPDNYEELKNIMQVQGQPIPANNALKEDKIKDFFV
jgi:hypothetical protein